MKAFHLRHFFGRFVHVRGLRRHYRRFALFGSSRVDTKDIPAEIASSLAHAAVLESAQLLAHLNTRPAGLTLHESERRLRRFGPNEIEQDKPLAWWVHLWQCYRSPFPLLLTVLAVVSYVTEDMKAAIVIGTMVALSVGIGFWQEFRSSKAADALKAMVSSTATVLRSVDAHSTANGAPDLVDPRQTPGPWQRVETPIRRLVPGDVVLLSAGDMVPADCRLLFTKDLFVSQAAMTGESLPVEKFSAPQPEHSRSVLDNPRLLFMGTNVVSGSATAVVVHTGARTFFGAMAQDLTQADRTPTQFQEGINRIAWLLIRFAAVMVPLVLLINGFTKGDWGQAFLFALSIAVGLTPEMLPMIVTTTLAKGAVELSKRKVIVKRLDAIQNFGAMDVLCTDKTGTLTQDKIFLAHHVDAWGKESREVLEKAFLNSFYQTGLKNLLDVAVLEHADVSRALDPPTNFQKIDELPFDFQRRRMSVVVSEHQGHQELICKGAVDEVLAACTHVRRDGHNEALTPAVLDHLRAVVATLSSDGLRVLAVAVKETPPSQATYTTADECNLTLVGYIAFLDPPKESAKPALAALAAHGVRVKVLTGDNELVTAKICHEVGLPAESMLLGPQIDRMSDAEFLQAVESHVVFAKLTPSQKERIVRTLKAHGHVVGFLGDGINDAAALRCADIGISVDSAVDIAKEAADIILLEKSLMVLDRGVMEGRKTFVNMLKYIKMTASSNFGNVLSVLVAGVLIPFLPMLPIHLLVQNLLYDISQIAIPFDNVDDESIQAPQRWNPADMGRFMLFFGPVSSVFDLLTYGVLWFGFGANTPAQQTLFQSGWFLEGLLTQTLVVHMIRTQKIPFLQSRSAVPLVAMTLGIMAIGIFIVMGPMAHYFKLAPMPAHYFLVLAGILAGYMLLTQWMKSFYAQHHGWQ